MKHFEMSGMPGGRSAPRELSQEELEFVLAQKEEILMKLPEDQRGEEFTPVLLRTQVVAGLNHFVKVCSFICI